MKSWREGLHAYKLGALQSVSNSLLAFHLGDLPEAIKKIYINFVERMTKYDRVCNLQMDQGGPPEESLVSNLPAL